MKHIILEQCGGAFGVVIDTATDVSQSQQLSFVIRFVTNDLDINERISSFKSVKETTGDGLCKYLKERIAEIGLSIENAIGSCTDGASNMAAIYSILKVSLQKLNPNSVFTWCASHRFNLVIADAVKKSEMINELLSSANSFAAFMRRSPKRITDWKEIVSMLNAKYSDINKRLRPRMYNATRWWSKFKTIDNICKTISVAVAVLTSIRKLFN